MKQFLFIKSATDVVALPASALLRTEYTGDTSISLFFETTKAGKNATTVVVLSVDSGKSLDAIKSLSERVLAGVSLILFDDVRDSFASKFVTGISSITTTEGPAETVPSGGGAGEFLKKTSGTDYDVEWSDVRDLYIQVRNDSGVALTKGTPVHATGVTGTVADVIAARADTASAMPATYVLNEDIANGAEGQAIITGEITGVDTSSFSPGDVLYVGATGGFTNVKPTGTNLIQNLGVVTKSNANTGSGVVYGSGRSNDVPNIPNGQAWIGNASGVATPTTLATVATSGDYDDLSNKPTRGGTYSYSGYATDVTKTATFYYQFPSATATSSSTDMISCNVAQGKSQATWGANGAMVLDGLSSTDSATYSMTIKVTTNTTIAIQTLSPTGGQFTTATQLAFSSPSEQTFTLTQASPTACLSQATNQWQLGLSVTFFAGGSIDFRVENLSITVS